MWCCPVRIMENVCKITPLCPKITVVHFRSVFDRSGTALCISDRSVSAAPSPLSSRREVFPLSGFRPFMPQYAQVACHKPLIVCGAFHHRSRQARTTSRNGKDPLPESLDGLAEIRMQNVQTSEKPLLTQAVSDRLTISCCRHSTVRQCRRYSPGITGDIEELLIL